MGGWQARHMKENCAARLFGVKKIKHFVSQRLLAFVLLDFSIFKTLGVLLTICLTFFLLSATGKMNVFGRSFQISYYILNMSHIKINFIGIFHMSGVKKTKKIFKSCA